MSTRKLKQILADAKEVSMLVGQAIEEMQAQTQLVEEMIAMNSPSSSTQGEETRYKAGVPFDGALRLIQDTQGGWMDQDQVAERLNRLEEEARAARLAADLATNALIALPCVSVSDTPCWERTDGYEGCTRCEALSAIEAMNQGGQHAELVSLRTALTEAQARYMEHDVNVDSWSCGGCDPSNSGDVEQHGFAQGLAFALAALYTPTGAGTAEAN